LTTLVLVGASVLGASTAGAVDTISAHPNWGGEVYLINGDTAEDISDGATGLMNRALVAVVTPGDTTSRFPAPPAGATGLYTFISLQGHEYIPAEWSAKSDKAILPAGELLTDLNPGSLIIPVPSTAGGPAGINAVAAAGGAYSVGFAYTMNNGLATVPGGVLFYHADITAGTLATATMEVTYVEIAGIPSTTSLAVSPTSGNETTQFTLTATVAPSGAAGDVEFFDGTTSLGSATLAGGVAVLGPMTLTAASHSLTAVYEGDATYDASTSPAVSLNVAGQPQSTITTVTATSATGEALKPVEISAAVTAANSTIPTGTVAFTGSLDGGLAQPLGSAPVDGTGVASITKSNLVAGSWVITASFTGTGVYQGSTDNTDAALELVSVGATDASNVLVEIPAGALTITTPYKSGNPLDLGTAVLDDASATYSASAPFGDSADIEQTIKITDTRAANPGFTAQVVSGDFVSGGNTFSGSYAGLWDLAAHQVASNALDPEDIDLTDIDPEAPGLGTAQTFAVYPAGIGAGTASITGTFGIDGVPTSVASGTYTATVTFTAF
jgi:hypothetical protein